MSQGNGQRPDLPDGWQLVTVGDVVTECRRGRPPAYEGGTTAVLNQKCIRRQTQIDLQFVKHTNEATKAIPDWAMLQRGDILINSTGTGTLGRVGWLRESTGRMTLDTHVTLVRPDPERVRAEYLGWFLHGNESSLVAAATGSTNQKELRRATVGAMALPLPPLDEQDRIIATIKQLLHEVDLGRGSLGQARLDLLHFRTALLQQLGGSNARRLRLDELGEVFVGATPKRSDPSNWNGDIPWVSSSEVAFCRIATTHECITTVGLGNPKTRLQPPGTVLLAMYGEGKTRGQSAILDVAAATNQAVAAIRVDPGVALPEFVYYSLMGRYEETRMIGQGGQQINLNKGLVKALQIDCPPLPEQRLQIERVEAAFGQVEAVEASLDKGDAMPEALRRSILSRLFSGQRLLSIAPRPVSEIAA